MYKFNYLSIMAICAAIMAISSGCSQQADNGADLETETAPEEHTCALILNAAKPSFDEENGTRSTDAWEDGDKIYLTYQVGAGAAKIGGSAVYQGGNWTITYYGNLNENETNRCAAVYFDKAKAESGNSLVTIDSETAIYEDTAAEYVYHDGEVEVTAILRPKTGRIRFEGDDDSQVSIWGIAHYPSYNFATGEYGKKINAPLVQTVVSGSTPYVYGEFANASNPKLTLMTGESAYTRNFPSSIFKKGESGYVTIPTEASHIGWMAATSMIDVNGVELNMIYVEYTNDSGERADFLLAETEMTTQQYLAITVSQSTSTSVYAKGGLSWTGWKDVIAKLNEQTGMEFRMPTAKEWMYAAKGGNKSNGYTYSGSNNIAEVAWYSDNSGGAVHEVAKLKPNELGFYDMSGNLMEVTSDLFGTASYYVYGGSYSSPAASCKVTSNLQIASGSTYNNLGLRVAMSLY